MHGIYSLKKLNGNDDKIIVMRYYSSMGSDSSEPEAKEASSNKRKFVPLDSMLEKLAAVNESHEN